MSYCGVIQHQHLTNMNNWLKWNHTRNCPNQKIAVYTPLVVYPTQLNFSMEQPLTNSSRLLRGFACLTYQTEITYSKQQLTPAIVGPTLPSALNLQDLPKSLPSVIVVCLQSPGYKTSYTSSLRYSRYCPTRSYISKVCETGYFFIRFVNWLFF